MECVECKGDGVVVETCNECGAAEGADECDRCDGSGTEERYTIPLKAVKAYLTTGFVRGEFLKLACIGKYDPDYGQLGRNFGAFLVRNTPKAYLRGIRNKLNEAADKGKF